MLFWTEPTSSSRFACAREIQKHVTYDDGIQALRIICSLILENLEKGFWIYHSRKWRNREFIFWHIILLRMFSQTCQFNVVSFLGLLGVRGSNVFVHIALLLRWIHFKKFNLQQTYNTLLIRTNFIYSSIH